ncbi:hypothetical protein ACFQU9_18940 [Actinomadura namibiensis]|uniref:aromatic-ring hydroxylase C-terminal domain-containing protein n=1 Tax=Actinomadura kijaniata TaxID=46161 RepID=UPI0035E4409B
MLDLTGAPGGPFGQWARPGLVARSRTLAEPPPEWSEVRAVLLRPDGHVAWAGTAGDGTAPGRVLSRILRTGGRRRSTG